MPAISNLFFIDAAGVQYPDYPTLLEALKSEYRNIYGEDVYLEDDSQDGQFIAILALSMYETMQVASAVYNSFSPATALSDALSRNVKINGLRRRIATFSEADLRIVGQSGTVITNGQAEDTLGQKWNLPTTVVIPPGGEITVTAIADEIGNIAAQANTINKINTPTLGWQSVNNLLNAIEGDPVETDAALRIRQSFSTEIPSLSIFEGTLGALAALDDVVKIRGYENDTGAIDSDGLPPHSIAIVIEGGDAQLIANTIATKKTPGTQTFGTTGITTYDQYGMPNVIYFFRPTIATISVEVSISVFPGYISDYAADIATAVADYLNKLDIGEDVYITKLYVPANLPNSPAADTFDITQLRIKKNAGAFVTSNLTIDFNELVTCNPDTDVTVIVV